MKKQNIEVEGGELLIQSKEGHYAIIPAKHRQEVMDMVKDGCDDCINAYIQTLPKDSDYAEDGSLYPEEPIINPNNPIQLKEVTITAEAPTYVKYKQEWEKENPFDLNKYIEDRFNNPVGREAIKRIDEKGWREQLKQEGLQKRQQELDEATKMGLLYQRFNPQDKDDISIADEQFQKRYGTSPHRYRYDNDPEYRKYYEQQARNATSKIDYPSTDLRRKDVVAPNNMWMYPNLTGESKKAMTDFSNEVIGMALPIPGLEAMGEIPSVFKAGKNLIKPASKAVSTTSNITGKGAQIAKNILNTASDTPTASIINKVDDVGKGLTQTPKPAWKMEELPGLHLKSTMENGAISKIMDKTGKINTEQALAIIAKESGGADKVALIRQGLGDNIPVKMDYNEFRKVVQDQLIPLERQFSKHASDYGIDRLGYYNTDDAYSIGKTWEEAGFTRPLENQTLILSNKYKLGRGSYAHGNPEETLGHIHFLRDAETPDIITATQFQSDAFQGPHRIMPKTFDKEQQLRSLAHMEDIAKRQKDMAQNAKQLDANTWQLPDGSKVHKSVIESMKKGQDEINLMKRAEIENFTQKQLLDKNHQERFLQEFVDYAAKRGDVNKIRVPTSETAAKIQGYSVNYTELKKVSGYGDETINEIVKLKEKGLSTDEAFNLMIKKYEGKYTKTDYDRFKDFYKMDLKPSYSSEHQTILKKYSEQPKIIKKLFGIEPKIVTDSKGNTWYEFDIPKKFKEGKGEIKAFGLIPPAIGVGTAIQSQQNKTK